MQTTVRDEQEHVGNLWRLRHHRCSTHTNKSQYYHADGGATGVGARLGIGFAGMCMRTHTGTGITLQHNMLWLAGCSGYSMKYI
jgi:hypothetical protein